MCDIPVRSSGNSEWEGMLDHQGMIIPIEGDLSPTSKVNLNGQRIAYGVGRAESWISLG